MRRGQHYRERLEPSLNEEIVVQAKIRFRGMAALIGTALLMFSGVASAQFPKKPDQKCINNINKGAAKVAKAQAGDNNACAKGNRPKITVTL